MRARLLRPAIRLSRLDFPTFDRPIKAYSGLSGFGHLAGSIPALIKVTVLIGFSDFTLDRCWGLWIVYIYFKNPGFTAGFKSNILEDGWKEHGVTGFNQHRVSLTIIQEERALNTYIYDKRIDIHIVAFNRPAEPD